MTWLILAFNFLFQFSADTSVRAEVAPDLWRHLGAVPFGMVRIELTGGESASPLLFNGTREPKTLIFNGKKIDFIQVTQSDILDTFREKGPGVYLNGEPVNTTGPQHRFFISLEGESAARPTADLYLRGNDQILHRATVPLNRTFLDHSLHQSRMVSQEQIQDTFSFQLSGPLPIDSTLEIEGAEISRLSPEMIDLKLSLKEGSHVLTGRLKQSGQADRLINLSVTVRVIRFDEKSLVLSFLAPGSPQGTLAQPTDSLEWPAIGDTLQGKTNPGAELRIGDKSIDVEKNGNWTYEMTPTDAEWKTEFKVKLGDVTKTFTQNWKCKEFKPISFRNPPFKNFRQFFIGLSPSSFSWWVPRHSSITEYQLANIHSKSGWLNYGFGIEFGTFIHPRLSWSARSHILLSDSKGTSFGRDLTITKPILAELLLTYFPLRSFGLTLGGLWTQFSAQSAFLKQPITGKFSQAGFAFGFQGRFWLSHRFEWTPFIRMIPKQMILTSEPNSIQWHQFDWVPFVIRGYLN